MTEFKTEHKVELWVHSSKEGFIKRVPDMDTGLRWIANRHHGKEGVNLVVRPVSPVLPDPVVEKCKPGFVSRYALYRTRTQVGTTPIL